MKNLPKVLLVALFAATVCGSCKKSSDTNPSGTSMSFTSNGTAVHYNTCIEVTATTDSVEQVLITGTDLTNGKPGSASFEVQIIHDEASLKAGQVYPAATTFGQANSSALLFFANDTDFYATQPGSPQGTVTITEVTSTTIKGTFSGKLFTEDDFTGDNVKYTITNGTFVAQRSK